MAYILTHIHDTEAIIMIWKKSINIEAEEFKAQRMHN
jgi:hypothetical protein